MHYMKENYDIIFNTQKSLFKIKFNSTTRELLKRGIKINYYYK